MNGNPVVVDRLSLLPDDIICHILSFLHTTKDSVKTSVLSKRYRCLFASVPVIDLDFDLYYSANRWLGDTERGFTQFMNKMLTSKERINKFRIPYMLAGHNSLVNSWICKAIMRNVEILDIGYWIHFINFGNSEDSVFLPNELFQCRTLVSLKLGINYSEILVPKNVDMPNLKELSLRFQNNVRPDFITISLQNLFTGCPVLEDLSIDSYISEDFISGGHVIVISIPSLKRLKLSWIRRMPKTIVDAPNLLQFDSSVEATIDIEMKILNCLVNDRITISAISSQSEGFSSLIVGTSCVQSLSLNVDRCQMDWFFEHCSLPKFPMLKHLELHGPINDRRESLAVILDSMPKLKCLVIDLDYMRHGRLEEEIEFHVPLNTPICFFRCLKEVEFRNFCGHQNDFELVQYILQHGKALRRMTIHHSIGRNPEKHGSCSRPMRCACYSRSTISVRKQLLALTKSSKTCEIVFA